MQPPLGIVLPVEIVSVYDGDTITVRRTWEARVRLLDCWAPEIRGGTPAEKQRGEFAKVALENFCGGIPICCMRAKLLIPTEHADRIDDIQSMGRILGHVWVGDDTESLSEKMVASGYATKTK